MIKRQLVMNNFNRLKQGELHDYMSFVRGINATSTDMASQRPSSNEAEISDEQESPISNIRKKSESVSFNQL